MTLQCNPSLNYFIVKKGQYNRFEMAAKGLLAAVPLDEIEVSDINVRKTAVNTDIDSLAENMRKNGLLQPVVVLQEDGLYKLIIGQRRFLAAKKLGWEKINALVLGQIDPIKATILSMSENIHRRELPYRDMVNACDVLYDEYHDIHLIADELGVSIQTVQNYLAHRLVPEPIKKMVEDKKISRQDALRVTNATMKAIIDGDLEKPLTIAKEISAMPKVQKTRVLDLAQTNPQLRADKIIDQSKRASRRIKITLEFSDEYKSKLEIAAKDMDMDIQDVVKSAVIQWLKASGYA